MKKENKKENKTENKVDKQLIEAELGRLFIAKEKITQQQNALIHRINQLIQQLETIENGNKEN